MRTGRGGPVGWGDRGRALPVPVNFPPRSWPARDLPSLSPVLALFVLLTPPPPPASYWMEAPPPLPIRCCFAADLLLPDLSGMGLYYVGLRGTTASVATLAELCYPLTALLIGLFLQHTTLSPAQWTGFGLLLIAVLGLSLAPNVVRTEAERVPPEAVPPDVWPPPPRVPDSL